ncbi:hypothetical protein KFE98_17215 [bacterium SCSIO 12741]|nr:hypothetical protein KFE98_17215 [bacterium SCSIO 12741]
MSNIIASIVLCENQNLANDYWLEIELSSPHEHEYQAKRSHSSGPFTNDILDLEVDMTQNPSAPEDFIVDLGVLEIDEEDGVINIDLLDETDNSVGSGSVDVKHATQKTRPGAFSPA